MNKTVLKKHTHLGTPAVPFLPYGRQTITDDDIAAVTAVLQSDWLTQGPAIAAFENSLKQVLDASEVVAVSNGTAALHLTMLALGLKPGEVVLTTPNTFVADANAVRYVGGEVQFVDIDESTGNIDVDKVAEALARDTEKRIKGVIAVHFAGQPVDLVRLRSLTQAHGCWLVDDACHALGASLNVQDTAITIGSGKYSDATVFSFHPVKHVATGEGGAISTHSKELAERLRRLRTHGISREQFRNQQMATTNGDANPWYYEQLDLGFNYRLTDIQAALGTSQLKRLDQSVSRRNQIARLYDQTIAQECVDGTVIPLRTIPGRKNAYHLYVVQIDFEKVGTTRAAVMNALREVQIGTQVHYIPIHLQPYYADRYALKRGSFPKAEQYYESALSLPMYPAMTDQDVVRVVESLQEALIAARERVHG
jgi:UDP-4-amino-4,6-dideoxy-N-acetyl-beta-L-altrosamine transaminase